MIGKEIGSFKIVEEIGEGGMGKVYKAFQPSLERYVAIKTIPPTLAVDKNLLDRFYTEARSLARLNHPNIISVFDIFEQDNVHYIAMEYVEGDSLGAMIIQKGPFSESLAVFIVKSITDALSTTHGLNIIHRDIKPDNIMISTDNRVKLMDFGLARNTTTIGMTATGSIMGTPEYMSPEQCEGVGIDGRSDLYALGITIFEALCGMTPFMGKSVGEIIKIKTTGMSPKIEKFRKDLSEDLTYIVNKLIEHDITYRYQNAHELIRDLDKSKFDMKSHPDKVTILSDSQVVSGKTPTFTALRRTFTRDLRYWGKKEVVWFLILATVFLSFATWGTVKFKERYDITSLIRSFRPLTADEKKEVSVHLTEAKKFNRDQMYADTLIQLEKVLAIELKNKEAINLKKQVERITQNADDLFDEAISKFEQGEYETSIRKFQEVLSMNPKSYEEDVRVHIVKAYNNLGTIYHGRRIYDKAVGNFKKALVWEKDNPTLMMNLAVSLHALKRYEDCLLWGKKAIEINPRPSDPRWFFFHLYKAMGASALELGRYDEAIHLFQMGASKLEGIHSVLLSNHQLLYGRILYQDENSVEFKTAFEIITIDKGKILRTEDCHKSFLNDLRGAQAAKNQKEGVAL